MQPNQKAENLTILAEKAKFKQQVFANTLECFNQLKLLLASLAKEYNADLSDKNPIRRPFLEYKDQGQFQAELRVAGDLLIFQMHTNVFEFDRSHGVWKTSYVRNNSMSTYSGIINIYNFLADSFRYQRAQDLGYLIGRIFINKDKHYFVEGKRQMGFLYHNFGEKKIDKQALRIIVETAMGYALNFDLLVPPYEHVKILSVEQMQEKRNNAAQQTAKRLGFSFNSDDVQGEEITYSGA